MTPSSSRALTDSTRCGAARTSEAWAEEGGARAAGLLSSVQAAAVNYVHGGEGLLMAPAYAVARMLEREGLTLQDFDFYEIHEAFASQVLATLKAWGTRCSARSAWASTRRSVRSTAPGST